MKKNLFYLELDYTPKEDDFVAQFYVEPNNISMEEASNSIAAESSIGTWTEVLTMTEEFREKFKARVIKIDGNIVEIAYPIKLFERRNIPQVYSSVSGNIFGMKDVKNLRLLSLKYPQKFVDDFKGPKFGIGGIREKLKIYDRPIVGTIVKPKIGLDPTSQSEVLYEAMVNGCDVVKDDENLTSQEFCPFEERVLKCLEKTKMAEDKTGEGKGYIPNVTGQTEVMLKRAEFVVKNGGKFIMVDIMTVGFAALQSLVDASFDLIIHGHRAMHAAITRNKFHGITMLVLSRTFRVIGVDQLHIGTAVGKMEGKREEVIECAMALTQIEEGNGNLKQKWNLKPSMPIASGGLHPLHIPELIGIFGKDCIFQFGGGIHGHPLGTKGGAKAVRQSLYATLKNIPLSDFAKENLELKEAFKKWG